MRECWAHFEPPMMEKEIRGEWVGCVFPGQKKKDHLFIGRVVSRFLSDEGAALNSYTTALEVNCLQEKLGTADNIFKEHNEGKTDVGVFPIHNIICGPLNANFVGSRKWDVPQHSQIRDIFKTICNVDREKEHRDYLKTILVEE